MNKTKIEKVKAREIIDSRGNPTVEVVLTVEKKEFKASVPSGASVGKCEAVELRDGGKRYRGKGVLNAVKNVNSIIGPKIKNKDVLLQSEIDNLMIEIDNTKNKSHLGANSILGVSMAVCRAGAFFSETPLYQYIANIFDPSNQKHRLPVPCFNIINGGVHAGNSLNFQEFMIVPAKKKFRDSLMEAIDIYYNLKDVISKRYSSSATNVGDEGGFAPPLNDPEEAINLILGVAKTKLIIDVAAGEFFSKNGYQMGWKTLKSESLSDYYVELLRKYPIMGLEDPFSEEDKNGWKNLMAKIPLTKSKILNPMIIGDDLLVTNTEKIKEANEIKACNAAIIKINQIGTITEAIEAVKATKELGWKTIVSHRSGETNDDFIADFSVGVSSNFIKSGAPVRGERVAKYNRLLEIEEEIN